MNDQFRFEMSFGARLDSPPGGDGARFRLWAPSAGSVTLEIEGRDPIPLRFEGGMAEAHVEGAAAGDRYRFRLDGELAVPDPAGRFLPDGVHGPSELIDPRAYRWKTPGWRGRPWHEAVLYELHLGTFTREGTAAAAADRLDDLAASGITAIELMPVAAAPGTRGWGYDGVGLYAPHAGYGRPEDLKRLIDEAHARELMVLLDVVYNHFGPDGNYLHCYARPMFARDATTPWGEAIAVDGPERDRVRRFFIDNALYWLEEYRFDGLRLDAVHALPQKTRPTFVEELGAEVAERISDREIHLVLENDANQASLLPAPYVAQWNDDIHHAVHRLITGESDGYYRDYPRPLHSLGRCLAEGFAYQGETSEHRGGRRRGEPSRQLPPTAFVSFLQNHDQIGNRAFGERITELCPDPAALDAATAIVMLSPQIPLLFQGQEWDASSHFLFFCDFDDPKLQDAVREGRRRGFARFAAFSARAARESIPDPTLESTFVASTLDWSERELERHRLALERTTELLAIRHREIVPLLPRIAGGRCVASDTLLEVRWPAGEATLGLDLNIGERPVERSPIAGERAIASANDAEGDILPPWGLLVWIAPAAAR
jgi:maltooligosyltrehalose trehalohydrolase